MKSALLLLLALVFSAAAPHASAQTVAGAPAFVDYQGTVFDGTTGYPLGSAGTGPFTAAPQNYTMQFKIYNSATGTDSSDLAYAETQTVTVSEGLFSVRLGAGAPITGLESKGPPEISIAQAFVTKNCFLELTVGASGTPISPRLAFMSSPFALVAERAKSADTVNGVVTATADSTFTGGTFTGGTYVGDGSGLTNLSGANISGSGSALTNLNGSNLVTGTVDLNKLVTAVREALCPPGTIVAYGGTTAPAGWLLCHGQSVSRTGYASLFTAISTRFGAPSGSTFNVPDFRGRFLRGFDGGAGRDPDRFARTAMNSGGATQDNVGSVQTDALKAHDHTTNLAYTTADTGGGRPATTFSSGDPSRVTGTAGGNETRPINANVNYIIKY